MIESFQNIGSDCVNLIHEMMDMGIYNDVDAYLRQTKKYTSSIIISPKIEIINHWNDHIYIDSDLQIEKLIAISIYIGENSTDHKYIICSNSNHIRGIDFRGANMKIVNIRG